MQSTSALKLVYQVSSRKILKILNRWYKNKKVQKNIEFIGFIDGLNARHEIKNRAKDD